MLTARDKARRALNQTHITAGLLVTLLGALALGLADALGSADVPLWGLALLVGWSLLIFGIFFSINQAQAQFTDTFVDGFFWSAMVAQLPVVALAALFAGEVRPVVLLFSMVLLAILIVRATSWQTLAYGGLVAVLYVGGSGLGWLLFDHPTPWFDLFFAFGWLLALGAMAWLAGHQHATRSRLDEQRRATETLANDRMDFVRELSHEIRNPLTMVLSPLDELMEESGASPRVLVAFRNAQRLARQVDRLLRHAEAEGSRDRVELKKLDVAAVLRGIVETYYATPGPGGVTISLHADGVTYAMADREALETVVINLVSNALKFSPEGGRVRIIVKSTPDGVRVAVSDKGPGIRPEAQARLFEPSPSVGDGHSRQSGTGLGLYRVRQLADAMEAVVGVDSRPGHGSQFYIVLQPAPVVRGAGSPRHLLESTVIVMDAVLRSDGTLVDIPEELPEEYVLVVEHDEDLRKRIVELLQEAGWSAVGVARDEEAMTCVSRQHPELIVTDWMPSAEVPSVVVRVREDPDLHSLPVVLLTARADATSRTEGIKAGADAYISKPFDREELTSTVANLLRLKARENDIRELNRRLREEVFGRFLPPSLVDDVVEGRASFDDAPETRSITTLVVDIVGFTKLTERMRATGIASYLSDYFRLVSDVVFDNQGFVDKFLGDGVLVHFGAPVRRPVDVQVACAAICARQLHERIQSLDQTWRKRGLGKTRLRIGIHHGPAAVGYLGTDRRTEYTAVGPSVNLAFKLRSVCRPGETFISGIVADFLDIRDVAAQHDVNAEGLGGALPVFRLRAGSKAPTMSPSRTSHTLDAGDRFGPYVVVRRIGSGGMAVVYEVRHETLDRPNALKVLVEPSRGLVARLVEEGKIQSRLDSPNIVPVLDVVTVRSGMPGLVMPLVEGCTLEDLLTRYRCPEDEAVGLSAAIASGLATAHAAGIIHRDLKPANVLLDTSSGVVVPRVADFGLARDHNRPRRKERGLEKGPLETITGQFLGTPIYAAPEQFRDASRVGPPADVWALGAIFFELLTGRCPFVNGPFSLIRNQVEDGRYDEKRVPASWRSLVSRMLASDPGKRPSSEEVRKSLSATTAAANALRTSRILGIVRNDEPTEIH